MPVKQSLSDLLDAAIKSIGSTWRTTLLVGGVLFVPASWVIGQAYSSMFGSLAQIMSLAAHGDNLEPWPLMRALLRVYAWSIGGAAFLGLVTVFVRACVTAHTWHAVSGRQVTLAQVVRPLAGRALLRLVGQRLLLLAINAVVLTAAMVPGVIAVAAAPALDAPILAIVLMFLCMAAGMGVVLWLTVRFGLALEAMVVDGLGVDASLNESARVVKGNWWRVLGRTLLIGLIAGFASSLIAAPIVMFALMRAYVELIQSFLEGMEDTVEQYVNLLETLVGLSGRMALSTYLSSLLTAFVVPGFMTLLYLDLKARHEAEAPAVLAEAAGGAPAAPALARPEVAPQTAPGSAPQGPPAGPEGGS